MSHVPTVSVVIPVHGVERFIGAALSSVLGQDFHDFEIVVVDDGSPDSSMDIVNSFVDSRIRVVSQPNAGLAAARNTGILASRGEFVALLDGDDTMLPEKLGRHVRHLWTRPELGVSYAGAHLIDEAGRRIGIDQIPVIGGITPADVFCGKVILNGSIPVFRRQALDDASLPAPGDPARRWYFDETLRRSEDVECWARVALTTGWTIGGLPGCLTEYRVNASGLSADVPRQLASWDAACAAIAVYAPEFIARNRGRARALELRYLARRSFQMRDPAGFGLALAAVRLHPAMLLREPVKTATTLLACTALRAIPRAALDRLVRAVKPGLS